MADKTLGQLADEIANMKIGFGFDPKPLLTDAAAAMKNAQAELDDHQKRIAALEAKLQ